MCGQSPKSDSLTRVRWGNINPLVLPTEDRVLVRVLVKTAVDLLDISDQKRIFQKMVLTMNGFMELEVEPMVNAGH